MFISNEQIIDLFDRNFSITIADLARMSGKSSAEVKRILMEEPKPTPPEVQRDPPAKGKQERLKLSQYVRHISAMEDIPYENIIVCFCEQSGRAAIPFLEERYTALIIDKAFLNNPLISNGDLLTHPNVKRVYKLAIDLRYLELDKLPEKIFFSSAAPPCTHLSRAGAWKWKDKDKANPQQAPMAAALVRDLIRWQRENATYGYTEQPIIRLWREIIKETPTDKLHPYQVAKFSDRIFKGDADAACEQYSKRTWLWLTGLTKIKRGEMEMLTKDITTKLRGGSAIRRSLTPTGLARAVFQTISDLEKS